ncbi:MAG: WYL domain-containing protein [Nakamurella sp.]
MRADRLLALLMVLRHRDRVTARELAADLEVSERTVLRDIEALGAAGVPVYAERGRAGGFSLLSGWTTDLSGLSGDEARALLIAGSSAVAGLGIGAAFSSGLAKVLSSLPQEGRRAAAEGAARILVLNAGWFGNTPQTPWLGVLQQAVTGGRRLTFTYSSGTLVERRDHGPRPATTRTVDPAGLVSAAGVWYLLALHRGERRIYRVDRIEEVRPTGEPLRSTVDPAELTAWWAESRARFIEQIADYQVDVEVPEPDESLVRALRSAVRVLRELEPGGDGAARFRATFAAVEHAVGTLWPLADRIVVTSPAPLRAALRDRAAAALALHE